MLGVDIGRRFAARSGTHETRTCVVMEQVETDGPLPL